MLIENRGYKVEYPCYSTAADHPDDAYDEHKVILVFYALDNPVYSPYDIKCGGAKNNLCDKGELVDHFD